jgi:hypothetical protein
MSFTTSRVRDNPFVIEILDTAAGQRSISGIDTGTRLDALEASVASLQRVIPAADTTAATITGTVATFQTGGADDYTVTVSGSVEAKSVTATDIYAQTYHTLCPYKVVIGDGKEVLHISENGNTGIGTATPATKLHVVGDVIIEGNLEVRGNIILRGGGKIIYADAGAASTD